MIHSFNEATCKVTGRALKATKPSNMKTKNVYRRHSVIVIHILIASSKLGWF
jgi:hypothetical protein